MINSEANNATTTTTTTKTAKKEELKNERSGERERNRGGRRRRVEWVRRETETRARVIRVYICAHASATLCTSPPTSLFIRVAISFTPLSLVSLFN